MREAGTLASARGLGSGEEGRGPVLFRAKMDRILGLIMWRAEGAKAGMTWEGLAGAGEAFGGPDLGRPGVGF